MATTDAQTERVREYLEGSSKSVADAENALGLTYMEVSDSVIDAGIEDCDVCGWWAAEGDYSIIDDEIVCSQCGGEK